MIETQAIVGMPINLPAVIEDSDNLSVVYPDYDSLVGKWIEYMKDYSGVESAQSERTYRGAIRQLYKYFSEQGVNALAATEADIKAWLKYLKATKKPATVQMYLVAVRLFYAFLAKEKVVAENPCKAGGENLKAGVKIKRNVHKREYLSQAQAQELIAKMPAGTEKELRDRAIVALMITAGLRCCEVSKALYEDLRTAGDYHVLYLLGKGHTEKDDYVKVAPAVVKMIRDYLKVRFKGREPKDSDFLFVSTSRNHAKLDKDDELSTQAIRAVAKKAFQAIGFDDSRHTAHSLRHTAATLMLRSGEALENVQSVLRHENIQTTLVYARALEREKNNAELKVSNMIFGE